MSMLIRPADLEIPAEDPFRHDVLGRSKLEPPLTEFVKQATGPLVLALDGPWGTGKTTFLKMWRVKLVEAGHACLYLNAWQTDFAKDPLVALVGELSKSISDFAPGDRGSTLRRHLKKARTVAGSIAKRSVPVAVKIATAGVPDTNELLKDDVADLASQVVQDRIKDYENGKSEIEDFRKSLEKLAGEVAKLSPDCIGKVVILIDELDRCRPTYAVEMLERIKHLFDVPGVLFVLGLDRSQLGHSIRALYGADFDGPGYLKRFVDLDYRLPEPEPDNYCSHLFKLFGIGELMLKRKSQNPRNELDRLQSILGVLFAAGRLSLRVQTQVIAG